MLNVNDTAMIIKKLSNDLQQHEMPVILKSMEPEAKADLYNSVVVLNEVREAIAKEAVDSGGLLFLNYEN